MDTLGGKQLACQQAVMGPASHPCDGDRAGSTEGPFPGLHGHHTMAHSDYLGHPMTILKGQVVRSKPKAQQEPAGPQSFIQWNEMPIRLITASE